MIYPAILYAAGSCLTVLNGLRAFGKNYTGTIRSGITHPMPSC